MRCSFTSSRVGRCAAAAILALAPTVVLCQSASPPAVGTDSATVTAGAHYRAGGLHRFLFGGTYRDLWTTPIRVPVLDLRSFAGGLRPTEEGGGNQTKSLHLITTDGIEYVFRSVDKDHVTVPKEWKNSVLERRAFDQVSSSYPAAGVMAAPMLEAAGVLQATPVLAVMPDDTLLGEFRADFAGRLGMIELSPGNRKGAPGFAGAVEIINSDTLLQLLDRDPAQRVDAVALLAARLMDMLLNDWDRHPGQWKWARFRSGPETLWEPIPRDRDHAFGGFGGLLPGLAGLVSSDLAGFDGTYPPMRGLTRNTLEFDRRLLSGLEKPVWDSVVRALTRRVTDSSIDAAMHAVPAEYQSLTPQMAPMLRRRRDALPTVANRFYALLASVVDIHATDAADRATVTRDDRFVEVRLESGNGPPYFRRRFDSRETHEIRLYLHGGDDSAVVIGHVTRSIPVWIIGGNGINQLIDSSTVGGRRDPTHRSDGVTMTDRSDEPEAGVSRGRLVSEFGTLVPPAAAHGGRPEPVAGANGTSLLIYPSTAGDRPDPTHRSDGANVTDVRYGPDTLFNRRPLVREFGKLVPQGPDHGGRSAPIVGLSADRDLGLVPRLGMTRYRYAFGHRPYSSMATLEGRYSFRVDGWKVGLTADKRREDSPVHVTALARMSQLELLNFHGLGNSTPQSLTDFFAVRQRQWLLQPAVALALAPGTDLSLGPVIQYSVTDTAPGHFVSSTQPYGFGRSGRFGQAGLRLSLHGDNRTPASPRQADRGMLFDVTGSFFPAVWDVRRAFGAISAAAAVYFTVPFPTHPTVGLRGGGRKVFGDAPFQEAAFIGGNATVRTLDPQRYAGDASLYVGAELRIPVVRFSLILPVKAGLLATEDIGRVYVRGDSPGGWHNVFGAGFWVAFHDLTLDIYRVIRVAELGRPQVITVGLSFP
jgi:hypothetical protein